MQHQLFFRFNTPFLKQAARQKEISQEKCRRRILLATFEWIFKISFLKGRGVVCHMLRDSNHMISSAIWNKYAPVNFSKTNKSARARKGVHSFHGFLSDSVEITTCVYTKTIIIHLRLS